MFIRTKKTRLYTVETYKGDTVYTHQPTIQPTTQPTRQSRRQNHTKYNARHAKVRGFGIYLQ